jgi:hypothetical protein
LHEYFQKPRIRNWDPTHDKLVQLALRRSAEFSRQVPKVSHCYLRFAADATADNVPAYVEDHVASCIKRIDYAREHAERETQRCVSALLATARRDALIHEPIVEPVIVFMFDALHIVLGELVSRPKYDDLIHRLLCEGFDSARRFERPDYHEMLVRLLTIYMTVSESRQQSLAQRLTEWQLIRYETAAAMRLFQAAQDALSEADELHKKNPGAGLSVATLGRIEREKSEVLKLSGLKYFAAYQKINLCEFYKKFHDVRFQLVAGAVEGDKIAPETIAARMEELTNSALMETAAAEEDSMTRVDNHSAQLKRILRLLGSTSGAVPSPAELIRHRLETIRPLVLTEFVRTAEFHRDSFMICGAFLPCRDGFQLADEQ